MLNTVVPPQSLPAFMEDPRTGKVQAASQSQEASLQELILSLGALASHYAVLACVPSLGIAFQNEADFLKLSLGSW